MPREKDIKDIINNICQAITDSTDDFDLYNSIFKDSKSMMEMFFDRYFEIFEGPSCSHDKSVEIVKNIQKAIKNKNNIKLSYTYKEFKDNDGNLNDLDDEKYYNEICYWCPKTIKDTDEALEIITSHLLFNFNYIKEKAENKNDNKQ